MQTASDPFRNSTSPYPRDLRGASPATAGAGKIYPVDPAAVARLNAFMASAPQRIRPPLSNEKAVVVGNGRKGNAAAKSKGATTMENPKKQTEKAEARTAVGVPGTQSTSQKNGDAPAVDLAAIYPAEVIEAAKEQRKVHGRRNLVSVFTPDVLAVWHRWHEEDGRTMAWIAKHNGLLKITTQQVSDYLRKYREALAGPDQPTASAETPAPKADAAPVVETAVSEETVKPETTAEPGPDQVEEVEPAPEAQPDPDPEPLPKPEMEAMQTAVAPFEVEKPENLPSFFDREYRPSRPGPADTFAALAALAGNEQLRVRGSVKLNLEIEFGD